MWFRQFQIFKIIDPIQSQANAFAKQLEQFAFVPCAPSMMMSMGFVPPIDEDEEPLARGINQCIMFTLQIEEKILPASVIHEALKMRLKEIERDEGRRVRQKEKLAIKDEIIFTLLPRAFSKLSKIYAYIDTKNNLLVINHTNAKKVEWFLNLLNKAVGEIFVPLDLIKPAPILTHWLRRQDYPTEFAIDRACVLQDPKQQNRIIRCHQQDLFAGGIQALLNDGCEVSQIALTWQDKIYLVLDEHLSFRSVRLLDEDVTMRDGMQTAQQQFNSDLLIMSELFNALFKDIFVFFVRSDSIGRQNAA